ncbi:hypothetical protein [Flocculibacter collagenilyticus]|uniref:hypothetical protein n=1 Tax=Flocculibacter collagenilyticus TaxID=2744479 RepID=UPI0018F4F777|nr:hypothetical protein [Flocculibacter collagenilyticus]
MNKKLIGVVALSLASSIASANTGLALIHGTGKQTNAYDDYWTGDFINSVKKGLPNESLVTVINCDFEQYMWDVRAAGCVADQVSSFMAQKQITDLKVITHSNGGNVMRWIMSNPTWDSRYPNIIDKTSRVIALAPSSGGTPLADAAIAGNVFESVVGWLVGVKNDAVRMQQVGWMANYNQDWLFGTAGRPSLPKTFEAVVGSDVDSAVWDGDSYCGGYHNQVGLEVTQNWLNSCSDGFLECSSQSAAGSTWFVDKQKTKGQEPLSHQQSRRKCFDLDKLIRDRI